MAACSLFIFVLVALQVFISAFSSAVPIKRRLQASVNPGCNLSACKEGCNNTYANVFYVEAQGQNDTLHYLISSHGVPSMLVVLTDTESRLTVDWDHFLSDNESVSAGSFKFSSKPVYSYAVVFPRILEYNDVDDKALVDVANANNSLWHDLADFDWGDISVHSQSTHQPSVTFTAGSAMSTDNTSFINNGSLSLKFQIFDEDGRDPFLPHLLHNANSSTLSFTIDHMVPRYSSTRYALELVMVNMGSATKKMAINSVKSIDDEYTPGIFSSIAWTADSETLGSYMQWKPVCYKQEKRDRQDATKARTYDIRNVTLTHKDTVVHAFYGSDLYSDRMTVRGINVSFGLSEDHFYADSMYISWSASIGYGSAEFDQVSPLIIIIISTGLGLPVLIIILGGIGVCIKRKRNVKSSKVLVDVTAGVQN